MTEQLREAVERASKLGPEAQNSIAYVMFEEMDSEVEWDELFAASQEQLGRMADEALAAHQAGLTEPRDPDKL